MAALIEDQIHQFLIDQEEERCRAIEAANNKSEGTKNRNKKIKRKIIQKPWTRLGESSICQEYDLLIIVCDYDYDLSDKSFQDYCTARGVLHVAGVPGSRRWEYMEDYRKAKDTYLSNPYFQFAEKIDGKQYRFTEEQMETGWTIMSLGRAKLQDCWELYSRKSRATKSE